MSVGADSWADAPEVTFGANGPTPSAGLTLETGEPNSWLNRTAWWKYTPTTDAPLVLDLSDSIYPGDPFDADTYLVVYTGDSLGTLVTIAEDDDGAGVGYLSRLTLNGLTVGETYWIQVGSYTTADDIDYVLTVSTYTVGPWRNDAVAHERAATGSNAAAGEGLSNWVMAGYAIGPSPTGLVAEATGYAWSGTPTTPHPSNPDQTPTSPIDQLGGSSFSDIESQVVYQGPTWNDYEAEVAWQVGYRRHTLGPGAIYEGDNADLPPDVWDADTETFVDPNVVGVEWDTDAPVPTGNMRMQVNITYGAYDDPSRTWRILCRRDSTDSEIPGFRTRSQLLADFSQSITHAITTADVDSISGGTYTLPWWDVSGQVDGADLIGGDRLVLAVVDQDFTLDGDPNIPANLQLTVGDVNVRQEYRLRYRLLYATARRPRPLRQYPRSDGLATSSARRLWPPPRSVQRSNRRAGGYR